MDYLRVGRISAVNAAAGTARVVYPDRDNAVTAEFPILSIGGYQMPAVDEMVLVVHLPSGPEAGIILGSFWGADTLPESTGPSLFVRQLNRAGTALLSYDDATGELVIDVPKGIRVNGSITATGKVEGGAG